MSDKPRKMSVAMLPREAFDKLVGPERSEAYYARVRSLEDAWTAPPEEMDGNEINLGILRSEGGPESLKWLIELLRRRDQPQGGRRKYRRWEMPIYYATFFAEVWINKWKKDNSKKQISDKKRNEIIQTAILCVNHLPLMRGKRPLGFNVGGKDFERVLVLLHGARQHRLEVGDLSASPATPDQPI